MNITIKSTGHDLSGASRALIEEKMGALEKLMSEGEVASLACEIEESVSVERAGAKYRAEGNLNVNGKLFRAEAMGITLEEAVDAVRDELLREVKHSKGKARHLFRRGGAAIKNMLRFDK
ncbi:MAG TPA: HPF/RaiA family ribosome-associated protein [Candidatus Paceibacterota bacterium]|nr:HPF/RaiA family ribosome-associated protein [Candidatus Paceibacterota bacterium]